MITINTAESALKNIYLESVIEDINNKTNPFLTMIGKNTKTIAEKDAKAYIRYGNEASVGAGAEDGPLPTSTEKLAEISVPLKNLFGSFQITDKAIKAAQNSPGAFASLIGGEMKNLVSTAQANLNRMVYGNGNPYLAWTSAVNQAAGTITVPTRFLGNLRVGQIVRFYNSNNVLVGAVTGSTITAINATTGVVNVAPGLAAQPWDRIFIFDANPQNIEMNGVDSIFMQNTLYNLARAEHPEILPLVRGIQGTLATPQVLINEERILDFLYELEEHAEAMPTDIILTHPTVQKALFENLKDNRTNIGTTEFAGGFKGFTFNGIPMYSDVRCMAGTVYALNSDGWAMQQLVDWTWLEGDDGSILRPVANKPVFSATLVKYADLICEKPFLQGKLTGFTGNVWR